MFPCFHLYEVLKQGKQTYDDRNKFKFWQQRGVD